MYQTPALAGLKRHVLTPSFYVFLSHGAHISGVEFQYLIQLEGTFWSNNLTLFADRAGFWVDNTILPARILSVWIRVWTTRRRSSTRLSA